MTLLDRFRQNYLNMGFHRFFLHISAFAITLLVISSSYAQTQHVVYSEPDKDDVRQTNFEIIGKVGANILIYKSIRENYNISVYDIDMKQKEKVKLEFLPDRIINADFLAYSDFCYMFYQYQKKSVVYCMAAKIDAAGKIMGQPITMDTTHVGFWASNKIYNVINSEDKQVIAAFKVNSKNERAHLVTTVLFDRELHPLEKKLMTVPMPERNDFLGEFSVDNDRNFVFAKAARSQMNDNIQRLYLVIKKRDSEEFLEKEIRLENKYLDDIRLKVDNYNKAYIITSFYSKTRYGNVEGLFATTWSTLSDTVKSVRFIALGDKIRNDAKGDNGMRSAFNDYFLKHIIVRKDGGFLLASESFFTTGRSAFNRSDYLYNSAYLRPNDYYSYSPFNNLYPWSRWSMLGQVVRYHAQNIAVFSFDSTGNISWSSIINKLQYDDETDAFIGYQMVNTGDQLHFLFNQQEKRLQLLSDQSISPSGQVIRNPTLKNLDKGYDFMSRYGKQIGSRQIIFPCMYRNYLCFARLDL
jgi:hypothetical protein